ncbi:MAG: cell envelope biogenesis protein OmpA [Desulfobacterales bacterium]|nr:cell envelope biogenesis protein OmpA [Desulfobacterales bacterium]
MSRRTAMFAFLVLAGLMLAGCGAKRPVLYPNAYLEQAGPEAAKADVDACMQLAREYVGFGRGGQVAKKGAKGAAVGAAAGAAVTAVLGGNVGKSAAAGAAGGGAAGATSGLFDAAEPDPVFQRFVEKCLQDKGYQVIGWK